MKVGVEIGTGYEVTSERCPLFGVSSLERCPLFRVSTLERCPLFRVSFIERFHCTDDLT